MALGILLASCTSTGDQPSPTTTTDSAVTATTTAATSSVTDDITDSQDLSEVLRTNAAFEDHAAGRRQIAVPIGFNQNRLVVVRTPEGYDPTRPWPLVVAYHVWGGNGDRILDRIEQLLGDAVDEYVVAAPDDYRQTILDAPPPVTSEHASVWRGVRARWNVDADRTYAVGYSLGGETTMTVATLHPGEFAGAVAMAAGYSFPSDVDGLWEAFLPNLVAIPVLHVWGAEDDLSIPGLNGRRSGDTLSAQNKRLESLIPALGLDKYVHVRLEDVGHSNAHPSAEQLLDVLTLERPAPPTEVDHRFRYIHQATAYWIEGHTWEGDAWIGTWPTFSQQAGEDEEEALVRAIFEQLGRIQASIEGQQITVETSHLADLTIWLSDGMIDWSQSISVEYEGESVFDGVVERDVGVALAQAERTLDFDRLRWAGIRLDTLTRTAHIVTPTEEFPPILREITLD